MKTRQARYQEPSKPVPDTSPRRRAPRSALNIYLSHHLWVAISSLGHLCRSPFSTLLTSSVIAIALALPAGMYVVLKNIQQLGAGWDEPSQITLFLQQRVGEQQALAFSAKLKKWDNISSTQYISASQALDEFRQMSGFADVIDSLRDNPLPAVILVRPKKHLATIEQVETLLERLRKLKPVELAQLDMEWLQRLQALIELGKRGIWILASLLGLAILLIVGNTIRLTIFNRRQEIIVSKLIGATNRFIRRPFLYTGFWYGLFGSVLAWILVGGSLGLLRGPVYRLSGLYDSQFAISGLDLSITLGLLGIGIGLGLLGAWLAVGRHLQAIEPT